MCHLLRGQQSPARLRLRRLPHRRHRPLHRRRRRHRQKVRSRDWRTQCMGSRPCRGRASRRFSHLRRRQRLRNRPRVRGLLHRHHHRHRPRARSSGLRIRCTAFLLCRDPAKRANGPRLLRPARCNSCRTPCTEYRRKRSRLRHRRSVPRRLHRAWQLCWFAPAPSKGSEFTSGCRS